MSASYLATTTAIPNRYHPLKGTNMNTKSKIVFSFLILSTNFTIAQYQSIFGNQQTEWNFISLTCDAAFVDSYIHERDTTINNIEYHIINNWGLLRESDQNSKLWYRNFHDDDEILIFDLSLTSGDFFTINSQDFIVDRVYQENGLKIIEFDYLPPNCGFYEHLKFKEGTGPNLGYKFSLTADDYETKLLRCQTKDSITINYLEQFGFGAECRSDLVNTKEIDLEEIKISPNPFSEKLTIQFVDNRFRTIEIYNLNGVKILDQNTSLESANIMTNELAKGIYLIRIKESNFARTTKVLKENQ